MVFRHLKKGIAFPSVFQVRWRPVVWGLLLQFIFGVLILRTAAGRDTFRYLGDRVSECLAYAGSGAKFVFGERYTDHFFAFSVNIFGLLISA